MQQVVQFEQVKFTAIRQELEALLPHLEAEADRLAAEFDPDGYAEFAAKSAHASFLTAELRGCQFADGSTIGGAA